MQVIVLDPKGAVAILDIRSLGYYKIQQGGLQRMLSKFITYSLSMEKHSVSERK